jgi:hypothetical protein
MGLKWLSFLIGPLDLIGIWFGEDQRANIKKKEHVFIRDWPTHLYNTCSTLNSEHNWEDLCIHSRSQQTCTSDTHN